MLRLSGLSFESRSGLFFGFIAFILSAFTGIVSGIGINIVLIRVLIIVPLFIMGGYVIILIFKKYVPEFYDALTILKQENSQAQQGLSEEDDSPAGSSGEVGEISDAANEEHFSAEESDINAGDAGSGALDPGDAGDFNNFADSRLDNDLLSSSSDPDQGKMGKHLLVDSSQFEGYEPSIMAEAVRTMMSKDKD